MNKKQHILLFVAIALIGLASGLSFAHLRSSEEDEQSSMLLRQSNPSSLQELAAQSDLVIVGTVGPIVDQGLFAGYDAVDRGAQEGGIPFVDHHVEIESILSNSTGTTVENVLTVRELGDLNLQLEIFDYPTMLQTGQRRLLFLNLAPDGTTYSPSAGLLSKIDLSGPRAVYYTGPDARAPFGMKLKPEEFISNTRSAIADLPPDNQM